MKSTTPSIVAPTRGLWALVKDEKVFANTVTCLFLTSLLAEKKTAFAAFAAVLITPMITKSTSDRVEKTANLAFLILATTAFAHKQPIYPLMASMLGFTA